MSETIEENGEVKMPVDAPMDEIEKLFTYHAPTDEQKVNYSNIREKAMEFARVINENCPASPDRKEEAWK